MKRILLAILACALLSGCAGSPGVTEWQASRHTTKMVGLRADMTVEQVVALMGQPDKTEMYRGKQGEQILIYLYITEGKSMATLKMTDANYTPLVFINNRLDGWGWNYLNGSAKKYEFTIKDLY